MKTDYDVIIVGAGPAGASCAKHLVDNGVKTLVIEKKKLPRYKCCCGFLSYEAFDFINKNFGDIPNDLYNSVKEIQVKVSKRGANYLVLKNVIFKNLKRHLFDLWLIEKTKSDLIDNAKVLSIKKIKDFINVEFKKDNITKKYSCRYLVGADGANSLIRKLFFKRSNYLCFSIQKVYENIIFKKNIDENFYHVVYSKKFCDFVDKNGFAWFLQKDNLLYIGTSYIDRENKTLYFDWEHFVKNQFSLSDLKFVRNEGAYCTYLYEEKNLILGDDNIFLIGEASGLMRPAGEGITSALNSGNALALSIITNFNNCNIIKTYKKELKSEINILNKLWRI